MSKDLNKIPAYLYTVTEKEENQRIDNLMVRLLKPMPKPHIYRMIRGGEVRVNKKRIAVSYKVQLGDAIRIPPSFNVLSDLPVPANSPNVSTSKKTIPKLDLNILYEDDYYLIIDKPSGVACHGGSGISFGIIEQLRQIYPQAKFLELAHRLDKNTSGVLILAKQRKALVGLQALIKQGNMYKQYVALTLNSWQELSKVVKAPLFKYVNAQGERRVKIDEQNGQFAHTVFKVLQKYTDFTLVSAILKTGKTHQIRVHLQHLDHPIAGDDKYGDFTQNKLLFKQGLKRMFLHAQSIKFIHPITNAIVDIETQLPAHLSTFLQQLK